MSDERLFCRVAISGKVQGVGYRYWALQEATRLGLCGYVRNRRDGTVEAVFVGTSPDVTDMLNLCRQGPAGAHVSEITQLAFDPERFEPPCSESFQILPTV